MDRKEALRILNLIGVTSQSQTELRYFELRANIEILIENANTPELKRMYRESAQSVEEAYELLRRRKESKYLTTGSATEDAQEVELVSGEAGQALSQMRAALSEVNQIRTYLQQYSALLEVQLAKAEQVLKKAEIQNRALEDLPVVIQELRTTAERNVNEIALRLEDARQLSFEMEKWKIELARIQTVSTGKSRFLSALTGRSRLHQSP